MGSTDGEKAKPVFYGKNSGGHGGDMRGQANSSSGSGSSPILPIPSLEEIILFQKSDIFNCI